MSVRPDPRLARAAQSIARGDLPGAYAPVAAILKAEPGNVAALTLMGDIALRMGRHADAMGFLVRAVSLDPAHQPGWAALAALLHAVPPAEALAAITRLVDRDPASIGFRNLHGAMLDRTGDYAGALAVFRAIIAGDPGRAGAWTMVGNLLKVLGRSDEAVDAYRMGIRLAPEAGANYWGLAELGGTRFTPDEIAAMRALLAGTGLADTDRAQIGFALGRALEAAADYADAFTQYAAANAIRRRTTRHDAKAAENARARAAALFTPAFFAAREGWGDPAPDPIFIVGMPRSGSTLVEQILAAHPAIEGTRELTDLPAIVRQIAQMPVRGRQRGYPDMLAALTAQEVAAIGHGYLQRTRVQRKTDRPHFIDKLPANHAHVGLIRLALPNARIIDVRRHPLACGVSIFRQDFAGGHGYAFALDTIGRAYADYIDTMALWDSILPGAVHHLAYEALVADPESAVRGLLDHLGLPFDPACLRFHESDRPVRTPSAVQVRQPLNTDGLEHWRHFEPWLDPLKKALGKMLA